MQCNRCSKEGWLPGIAPCPHCGYNGGCIECGSRTKHKSNCIEQEYINEHKTRKETKKRG